MKNLLITLFFLIHFSSIAQDTNELHLTDLDSIFEVILKEWKAPGFAVAVVDKGEMIYAKGFGYRDYENKLPVTPHTQFAIGSCAKAFTTTLLGLLRKIGAVEFDSAVINYIPELRFYTDELTIKVTVKDLMTHRTGLPRYDRSWNLWPTEDSDNLIKRIQYMKPVSPLRAEWHYNNWMYFLLGVVSERITGDTWEKNMEDYIFGLLGMTETTTSWTESESYGDVALGYRVKNDSIIDKIDYHHIQGIGAAVSINSTVIDMAKWLGLWTNGGKVGNSDFIPARYFEEAISSQMVAAGSLPGIGTEDLYFNNYGYGWMISSYRGHYRVEHGGNIDGFTASTCFFPSDSVGIVVLSNQGRSVVPALVRNLLADHLLRLPPKDWHGKYLDAYHEAKQEYMDGMPSQKESEMKDAPPSHPKVDYTGKYQHPAFGAFQVEVRHDSLLAHAGNGTMYLKHDQYDVFLSYTEDAKWGFDTIHTFKIQFYMNISGEIGGFKIDLNPLAPPVDFVKYIAKEKEKVLVFIPGRYIGTYGYGVEIKIILSNKSTLIMIIPGQGEYDLRYVGGDRFAVRGQPNHFVQFEHDENGYIYSLTSHQPDMQITVKKIPK